MAVRTRRTSTKKCEDSNNEPKKSMKSGIEEPAAGAVSFRAGSIGEVGLSGLKWAERRKESRIRSRKSLVTRLTRLNPLQPALTFWRPLLRSKTMEGIAKLCGKSAGFYAFFHEVSRFYAQIRAVFTRFYAFLRVGLIFPIRKPGNEESRNEKQEKTAREPNSKTSNDAKKAGRCAAGICRHLPVDSRCRFGRF